MSKKVIAIDVDDVLAANAAGFVAYSNKRWGTNLTVEDYHEHWGEIWQVGHEEAEERSLEMHNLGIVRDYEHDDTALPVLQELKKKYKLVTLTSRRLRIKQPTIEWLDKHYAGIFDEMLFAGIFDDGHTDASYTRTKLDALKKAGASYLIDDHTKHCFPAAEAGIKAVLFGDYKWNQADELPANVTRCHDWQAVSEYFKQEARALTRV